MDNQRWLTLWGGFLNGTFNIKQISFSESKISVLYFVSQWMSSIHFSTKHSKGLQNCFMVLWIWWQTSSSMSKSCRVLFHNNFSSPPLFPLIWLVLSLTSETRFWNGISSPIKQLQIRSDRDFVLTSIKLIMLYNWFSNLYQSNLQVC